jgi:hypothetical protein
MPEKTYRKDESKDDADDVRVLTPAELESLKGGAQPGPTLPSSAENPLPPTIDPHR